MNKLSSSSIFFMHALLKLVIKLIAIQLQSNLQYDFLKAMVFAQNLHLLEACIAHYELMYRASTDQRTGWLGRDDCCASWTKIKFIQQMYDVPSLLVPPAGDLKYGK